MKHFNNRMIPTSGHSSNNMKKALTQNIRLGIFVTIGILFLVLSLYYIGSKQNLFGSSLRLKTYFYNISGLRSGNNVRFSGIDIGTVESIEVLNDTLIVVTMLVEEDMQPFIKKNALASIGTDGLMGNKLVNINPVKGASVCVADGDLLASVRVMEMDESMRLLNNTNNNINVLSANLREISEKVNTNNSLWQLLDDRTLANNVRNTLVNLRVTGRNSAILTGDLRNIIRDIRQGKGTVGTLITDTTFAYRMNQTIINIQSISDSIAYISGDFLTLSSNLKNGKGTMGMLFTDTAFVHTLNESMLNIENGTRNFNDNMEALKHAWPFKKHFSKQKKR